MIYCHNINKDSQYMICCQNISNDNILPGKEPVPLLPEKTFLHSTASTFSQKETIFDPRISHFTTFEFKWNCTKLWSSLLFNSLNKVSHYNLHMCNITTITKETQVLGIDHWPITSAMTYHDDIINLDLSRFCIQPSQIQNFLQYLITYNVPLTCHHMPYKNH